MKKAKIFLSTVVLLSTISVSLAFKAAKRSVLFYYTTTVYNATCTKTLTRATTTIHPAFPYKYYTFTDNQRCRLYARLTTYEN